MERSLLLSLVILSPTQCPSYNSSHYSINFPRHLPRSISFSTQKKFIWHWAHNRILEIIKSKTPVLLRDDHQSRAAINLWTSPPTLSLCPSSPQHPNPNIIYIRRQCFQSYRQCSHRVLSCSCLLFHNRQASHKEIGVSCWVLPFLGMDLHGHAHDTLPPLAPISSCRFSDTISAIQLFFSIGYTKTNARQGAYAQIVFRCGCVQSVQEWVLFIGLLDGTCIQIALPS